jgi:hypothetical protein
MPLACVATAPLKSVGGTSVKFRGVLGRVDGFDQDEAADECEE